MVHGLPEGYSLDEESVRTSLDELIAALRDDTSLDDHNSYMAAKMAESAARKAAEEAQSLAVSKGGNSKSTKTQNTTTSKPQTTTQPTKTETVVQQPTTQPTVVVEQPAPQPEPQQPEMSYEDWLASQPNADNFVEGNSDECRSYQEILEGKECP